MGGREKKIKEAREVEAPQASNTWAGGIFLSSRLWSLGERRNLPQRGPGRDPVENEFRAFLASHNTSGVTSKTAPGQS